MCSPSTGCHRDAEKVVGRPHVVTAPLRGVAHVLGVSTGPWRPAERGGRGRGYAGRRAAAGSIGLSAVPRSAKRSAASSEGEVVGRASELVAHDCTSSRRARTPCASASCTGNGKHTTASASTPWARTHRTATSTARS